MKIHANPLKEAFYHSCSKTQADRPKNRLWIVMGLLIGISLLFLVGVIIYNAEGEAEILPDRRKKLEDDLQKLDHAEQYALLARTNGMYICASCPDQDSIFLLAGEVWKYGITINGKKRYTDKFLLINNLQYFREFEGNLLACMQQEKIKIFHYPTLPENLKRETKLLRPPGNKEDR